MPKYIIIERPNGIVTMVRSELETPSENPLTEHEQIINELWKELKDIKSITLYLSQEQESEWNKACLQSMGNVKIKKY